MAVKRFFLIILVIGWAFSLIGCTGNAVISGIYSQSNLFQENRLYHHDFSSPEDAVKIYLQARPDKKVGKFTQMLTLTHINGQQLASGLSSWNPKHTKYYRVILADSRCGSMSDDERAECISALNQYVDNISNYMQQLLEQDRPHRLRGQQTVRMKAGMHTLTLLLYGHSNMGRGDIGVYDVPDIFYYPGNYQVRFTVDGIFVNQRKVHIWIENEDTKEVLWELKTKD